MRSLKRRDVLKEGAASVSGWFHCSVKKIQRSTGRSVVAAAAYRSASLLTDERTGQVHDYRPKGGVVHAEIVAPENAPAWMHDRAALWNAAEAAENRKDAVTGREVELALPADLSDQERLEITRDMAAWLSDRYGVVVDFAIHRPHRDGDDRNDHAHLLMSVRGIEGDGFAAKKNRALDDIRTGPVEITAIREAAAGIINRALERAGSVERVDHRSLEDRGEDREPTQHLGPAASQMDRQGRPSRIAAANRKIRVFGEKRQALRRQLAQIDRSIQAEQGRAWQGQGKAPRSIDRPFNWTARAGVKDAAQRLRTATAAAQATLKGQHQAARDGRKAELARYYADRRAMRDEIREKYRAALDGIWNRPAADGLAVAQTSDPAPPAELARVALRLADRERGFRANEATALGRLANARAVAGDGAGMFRIARLALDGQERRRAFDAQQRTLQATVSSGPAQKSRPQAMTPEPRQVLAARKTAELKAGYFAAYSAHEQQTRAEAIEIKARHAEAGRVEGIERQALGREIASQWQQFRTAYGLVAAPARPFNRAAPERIDTGEWKARLQARADARFRPGFAPRSAEQGTQPDFRDRGASGSEWREHWNQTEAKEAREQAEGYETTPDLSEAFPGAENGQGDPIPGQGSDTPEREAWMAGMSDDAIAHYHDLNARHAAERQQAAENSQDPGRTLRPGG